MTKIECYNYFTFKVQPLGSNEILLRARFGLWVLSLTRLLTVSSSQVAKASHPPPFHSNYFQVLYRHPAPLWPSLLSCILYSLFIDPFAIDIFFFFNFSPEGPATRSTRMPTNPNTRGEEKNTWRKVTWTCSWPFRAAKQKEWTTMGHQGLTCRFPAR